MYLDIQRTLMTHPLMNGKFAELYLDIHHYIRPANINVLVIRYVQKQQMQIAYSKYMHFPDFPNNPE